MVKGLRLVLQGQVVVMYLQRGRLTGWRQGQIRGGGGYSQHTRRQTGDLVLNIQPAIVNSVSVVNNFLLADDHRLFRVLHHSAALIPHSDLYLPIGHSDADLFRGIRCRIVHRDH